MKNDSLAGRGMSGSLVPDPRSSEVSSSLLPTDQFELESS